MPAVDLPNAFEVIAGALAPFLGPTMSKAAVEVNRKKLGLSKLSNGDLERLLEELRPGVRVFLGPEQTTRVLDGIRAKLAMRGTPL
jgi:hypothetical protein